MPLAMSTSMTRVVTRATAISTAAWASATVPMPMTLPISSCLGRMTASSTSTTRDAFSRVTAVTTHWPYVCRRMNSRMLVIVAVARRLESTSSPSSVCSESTAGGGVARTAAASSALEPGGPQPVLQGQVGRAAR